MSSNAETIAKAINDTTADAAAAAAQKEKRRRAMQMKDFRTEEAEARAMVGKPTVLATVAGFAFKVTEKLSTPPGATEPTISYLLWGEFEAEIAATGEVIKGASIYLPTYFATEVAAMLASNKDEPVGFAIRILMEPNPRKGGVRYQYAVSNVLPQRQSSRMDMLKRELAAAGQLGRLAPPASAQVEHDAGDGDGEGEGEGEGGDAGLPGGDNSEATATRARRRAA